MVNKFLNTQKGGIIFFTTALFFALFLRIHHLDNRPMHVDEAVHAIKFGQLLENNYYRYDPIEYHGPTLNYLTLIPACATGITELSEVSAYTLRFVPVSISLLLLFSLLLLQPQKGRLYVLLSLMLLILSPAFLFYSRYYIQETLLVSFSLMALVAFYRYFIRPKTRWILLAGILSGLTFATKETSIITAAAATASLFILLVFNKSLKERINIPLKHSALFLFSALIPAILLYSSFFTNMQGIADSVLTYGNYFTKAGSHSQHIHPWYYYLKLLLYSNTDTIFFTEIPVFIFGISGIFFSFRNSKNGNLLFKFLSLFSLLQLIVYSLLPYKTPWLLLNFWTALILLSAFGIIQMYRNITPRVAQKWFIILIILLVIHSGWQTFLTSFKYPWQPANPFTYAQATPSIISAAEEVTAVAKANTEGLETVVYCAFPNHDYWPLPWYLRTIKNIAWHDSIKRSVFRFPIILAAPEFEEGIIQKLYVEPPAGEKHLYLPLFEYNSYLRPGVEMRGYVQKDIYDLYLRYQDDNP